MWTFTLIVLAIVVLTLGAVAWQLLKLRMSPPVYRALTNDAFPPHAMNLLQPMARELGALGMQYAGLQHERRSTGEDSWQAVFRNEDGSVWAVGETYAVAKQDRTRLVLQSYFADGSIVVTCNDTFADISVPPNWRLVQKTFDDCAEQLKAHQGSILGMGGAAQRIDRLQTTAELRERYAALGRGEQEHLREKGYLVPTASDPNTLRIALVKIPWLTLRVLWMVIPVGREEAKRAEKLREQTAQAEVPAPEATPETRRLELYREESEKANLFGKLGWTGKGLVFLLSMLVFMAVFYFRGVLDLTTLGWVVIILIVHELGHALTMRLFGYRDVQIFFIPFLGAAAAGVKKRVPAWQEFWVFIMGPLPGLVVGWAIMGWSMLQPGSVPQWAEDLALWSVILNGFNLLPFLPLDGGRIVELLIFNRLPTVRVVFMILGGLALLPLALLSWWFVFLAALMLMTVPEAIRLAGMSKWIRHNLRLEDTEDEALLKTFQIIDKTGNEKVYGSPAWPAFVDRIVQMGCGKRMGFLGTAAALGLYAMLIGLPVLLGIGLAIKTGMDHAGTKEKLAERIAALETEVILPTIPVGAQTRELLDATEDAYWNAPIGEDYYALGEPGEDMDAMMDRIAAQQQEQFAHLADTILPAARKVRWDEVPAWVAEDESGDRQEIVHEMVQTLVTEARTRIDEDKHEEACPDLTLAYWAIASCEPRQSFSLWQAWMELEWQCLNAIEEVAASGRMKESTRAWLAASLPNGPRPAGPKIALLSLYDADRIYSTIYGTPSDLDSDEESSSGDFGLQLLSRIFTGVHIEDHLAVAELWETQTEVSEVAAGGLVAAEQWNYAIRRIRRVLHYRELGALALTDPVKAPGALPEIDGIPVEVSGEAGTTRWMLTTTGADADEEALEWRVPAAK